MRLPRIYAPLSLSHLLTFSLSHFLLHHSNTSDGRRWSVVGCANAVIPATSGRPESDGAGRFTTDLAAASLRPVALAQAFFLWYDFLCHRDWLGLGR
jgi:hypothetical protein